MMDTPPPKRRATLRDTYAGDHQLVSAGDGAQFVSAGGGAQLVSDGDGVQLVGAGDGDGAHGSPSCAGDGDGAHGRHKRGRPKGSTKERLEILREHDEIADDGDNQQWSRARICRDAAVARWSRVLAKQQHVEAADAAGSSRDIVVHPMVDQSKLVVVPSRAMENTELAVACVAASDHLVAKDMECYKETHGIFMSFSAVCSVRQTAATAKLARMTITRRRRLMGAFLTIFRQTRIIALFHVLHRYFKEHYGNVRALHYWEKLKYDEVSMRVSVAEFPGEACKSIKEKAIVKLLNCTSTHAAIFEVDGEYVTVVAKSPTTVRSIEKNSAESLKAALQRQSSTPSWAREEFETCGRMIIADDHSANRKCDLSVAHDNREWQLAAKFLCFVCTRNIALLFCIGWSSHMRRLDLCIWCSALFFVVA